MSNLPHGHSRDHNGAGVRAAGGNDGSGEGCGAGRGRLPGGDGRLQREGEIRDGRGRGERRGGSPGNRRGDARQVEKFVQARDRLRKQGGSRRRRGGRERLHQHAGDGGASRPKVEVRPPRRVRRASDVRGERPRRPGGRRPALHASRERSGRRCRERDPRAGEADTRHVRRRRRHDLGGGGEGDSPGGSAAVPPRLLHR
mmetsp:Transcript_56995/g.121011  ORF Transcript_56995/g.121011 Transcript_56995/m.121011 type:complete len:200 (+) Transcript_56995:592-1191(+)